MNVSIPGRCLALACCALNPAQVLADAPLYARNLAPVAGLLGLPSQREASTREGGSFGIALHGSVASHYVSDSGEGERVLLDGETRRFALQARYGLAEDWELELEVPWLRHSGGELDDLIDSWHDLWGMPDGGRSAAPADRLRYGYRGDGGQFLLEDDVSGLGDISLSLHHTFYRDDEAAASVAVGYKFASGEERDFLGSGGDDVYAVLRFSSGMLQDLPLRWHGQLGYLRAGASDLLKPLQERDLWFAGLTLDWAIAPTWSLLAQVDSHAAPLDSELTALGDDAVFLTLGARWRFAQEWAVDVSFIEDIRVETAPDITFQASLRYR
ncbi:MAG: DUF3187 family protein [Halioglobus sp.]